MTPISQARDTILEHDVGFQMPNFPVAETLHNRRLRRNDRHQLAGLDFRRKAVTRFMEHVASEDIMVS